MKKFKILSLICLFLGIIFFILGFFYGDVKAGIFVIFPFLAGSGIYAFIGFIFIFIAILMYIFSFSTYIKQNENQINYNESQPKRKQSIKGGGVVLIGPIPIVFGSNWKIALIMMILAIIFIIIFYLLLT